VLDSLLKSFFSLIIYIGIYIAIQNAVGKLNILEYSLF
jgi:hypothetical protein